MSRESFVSDRLAEFASAIGLSLLAMDETRRASFLNNGRHYTLQYSDDPIEVLWVFVDLGTVNAEDPELLRGVLGIGYVTWAAGVLTVGLDSSGQRLLGAGSIPVGYLNAQRLRQLIDAMDAAAAEVHRRIETRDFQVAG
jgi:hypothetical protein